MARRVDEARGAIRDGVRVDGLREVDVVVAALADGHQRDLELVEADRAAVDHEPPSSPVDVGDVAERASEHVVDRPALLDDIVARGCRASVRARIACLCHGRLLSGR
jgi:hypothetical protein